MYRSRGTRHVQLSIWIIAISVVVGPILLGLLLYRLGFSRAVVLGLGMAILGGAILLNRDPLVDLSDPREIAANPSPLSLQEESAARRTMPAAAAETEFVQEKAAHEDTRRALDIAKSRIMALEAERRATAGAPTDAAAEFKTARERLQEAELRLAIANAEIERLKAALRAAEPIATAVPLPATPQPFAHAPATEHALPPPAAPTSEGAEIATGATVRRGEPDDPITAIGRTLAEAMRSQHFALVKLSNDELVEGRRGSYYRITCPGNDNVPLRFSAGNYTFESGYAPLATCFKAVQGVLLDALPSGTRHRLYVQGFASPRSFIRPKPLPVRDTHLRSITYLPRMKDLDRFATAKTRQTTGRRFTNTELPNLRAANVAHWIGRTTNGAIQPDVLEGQLKPGNQAISQSFALLLYLAW